MRRPVAFSLFIAVTVFGISTFAFYHHGRFIWYPLYLKYRGARTVADVIHQYGEAVTKRLSPAFAKAAVAYPPVEMPSLASKLSGCSKCGPLRMGSGT